MTALALVHIGCMLLLPIWICWAIQSASSNRRFGIWTGVVLIMVSLLAFWLCRYFWPFDYMIARGEMLSSTRIPGYQVTLVQRPGVDFYETFFEIRRLDGTVTRVLVDGDDNKWWQPRTVSQGPRIYFLRGSERITGKSSFVDTSDGTLLSGYLGNSYSFAIWILGDRGTEREGRKAMGAKSYISFLNKELEDTELAAEYLSTSLESGSIQEFLLALRNVADAHGGVGALSETTNLNRQSMYKMLSEEGNPTLASLIAVLNAMGIHLSFKAADKSAA